MQCHCWSLSIGAASKCSLSVHKQVEEAAADRQRQLAGHVEELERQLEGASHDLEEWQGQANDANEHAQQLQQQLQALNSRAEHA